MNNRPGHFMVEFHEGDAPMLVHAMMIASTTAMMCGHPGARDRFNEYRDKFEEHVPAMARIFDEEAWGEIVMALQKTGSYEIIFTRDWRAKWNAAPEEVSGRVVVAINGKKWESTLWSKVGEEEFKRKHVTELLTTLNTLAPMDCTGTITEGERE